MHRYSIRKVKLVQIFKIVNNAFFVHNHRHIFKRMIYKLNIPDIAVENTASLLARFGVRPLDVIVVSVLHNLVALAEGYVAEILLIFLYVKRIDFFL